MKQILTICFVALLLASCSHNNIEIEGNIKGLGSQKVHIVYHGDGGTIDDVIMANEGRFKTECMSSELTVITIIDFRGTCLAQFAAQNSDHITIKGEISKPDEIIVEGNDVTEKWMAFRNDHSMLYNSAPSAGLNQEIEKWVKAHPKDPCSTLLLLFDHSALMNETGTQPLLNNIDPKARPERMLAAAMWINEYYSRHTAKEVLSLNLCGTNGEFEPLNVKGKATILYFWSNNHEKRSDIIAAIKGKLRSCDAEAITIADVLVDADTTRWATTCRADSATWGHYWVPGGVTDIALRNLRIPTVPFFVATDSLGHIVYRGTSIAKAIGSLP